MIDELKADLEALNARFVLAYDRLVYVHGLHESGKPFEEGIAQVRDT